MKILISNDQIQKYPYSFYELRRDNPQISFPDDPSIELLTEWGVFSVTGVPRPEVDHMHNTVEQPPVQKDGTWMQNWIVTSATPEEVADRTRQKSDELRSERNNLLTASDWTQCKDIPDAISDKWAQYRQQLRDITQQPEFPWGIQWPKPPAD